MEKEEISEVVALLKNNYFEEVEEYDEERLEDFYSLGQIKKELKLPIENNVLGQALNMLGLRMSYKGHTIPGDPDRAAFIVRENIEEEKYIQVLFRKNILSEVDYFVQHDETFNKYMKDLCFKDYEAIKNENDFVVVSVLTTGPSEFFSHIISVGLLEIKNGIKTGKVEEIFIDNELSEKELESYIEPYKEGMRSRYEQLGIALPGMEECHNSFQFEKGYFVLRKIYGFLKGKNVVVSSPEIFKGFVDELFKKHNISEEHRVENIAQKYISIIRAEKNISDKYFNLMELQNKYRIQNISYISALSECERVADILLKQKKEIKSHNY